MLFLNKCTYCTQMIKYPYNRCSSCATHLYDLEHPKNVMQFGKKHK